MSPEFDWRQLYTPTADEYQRRATKFRATDPEMLRLEVRKLQQQGLLPRDIGQALGLNPEQVRTFMEGR
jgi:hypothetical protein